MNPEWQAKVEYKLDSHDKDLHSIAGSLQGINEQMQKTNSILQDFALKDERFNSKLDKLESTLNGKIETNSEAIKRAHTRGDKVDAIINRLAWTVITIVLVGMIGAVVKFG